MNEVAAMVFVAISFDATIEKWCLEGSEFSDRLEYETIHEALEGIKRMYNELVEGATAHAELHKP